MRQLAGVIARGANLARHPMNYCCFVKMRSLLSVSTTQPTLSRRKGSRGDELTSACILAVPQRPGRWFGVSMLDFTRGGILLACITEYCWPATIAILLGSRARSLCHHPQAVDETSIKHQASSVKYQASSIKHQASSIKRRRKTICIGDIRVLRLLRQSATINGAVK